MDCVVVEVTGSDDLSPWKMEVQELARATVVESTINDSTLINGDSPAGPIYIATRNIMNAVSTRAA